MVNGKVGFGKDEMCSYKLSHNSAVHTIVLTLLWQTTAAGRYFTRGANTLKLAGKRIFFIGAFVDTYQGVNHLRSGNAEGVIRSGENLGIGAAMTFGGPIGFFGGLGALGVQYGIDNGYLIPGVYKPDWQTQGICFVAGTEIQMGNGSVKNIEDVVLGDIVLTYNLSTQKIEQNAVLQVDKPIHLDLVEINFANGLMNTNTPDHPYYVKGKGWSSVNPNKTKEHYKMDVKQLEKGDTCFVYDSKNDELLEVVITTVTHKKEKTQTYNLTKIANNSNFFANGVLVHNKYNPVLENKEVFEEENQEK